MDSIDFDNTSSTNSVLPMVFKVTNFIVGGLMFICGFTELITGFDYFFQGIYVMIISTVIIYLEFQIPPKLFTFASSFFSFLGRGAIYLMLSILNFHGSSIRIELGLLVFVIGWVYIGLQFTNIQPPKNMQGEVGLADDILEDVI